MSPIVGTSQMRRTVMGKSDLLREKRRLHQQLYQRLDRRRLWSITYCLYYYFLVYSYKRDSETFLTFELELTLPHMVEYFLKCLYSWTSSKSDLLLELHLCKDSRHPVHWTCSLLPQWVLCFITFSWSFYITAHWPDVPSVALVMNHQKTYGSWPNLKSRTSRISEPTRP